MDSLSPPLLTEASNLELKPDIFGARILNKAEWRQMRQTKLRLELELEPDTSSLFGR